MKRLITHNNCALLLPYCREVSDASPNIGSIFLLSFGDAFRMIIKQLLLPTKNILVPDFYCPETLELFSSFANLVFYKTNRDLTIDAGSYIKAVEEHNPQVIINYGFINSPLADTRIKELLFSRTDIVVIEDSAHKLTEPKDVRLIHKNHFFIDSVRKQTAILGSHLYFSKDLSWNQQFERFNFYRFVCAYLRAGQEIVSVFAWMTRSQEIYELSETFFELLNSRIGTNPNPTAGSRISRFLFDHVDKKRIRQHKANLIEAYINGFLKISENLIFIPPVRGANITYFPCIVPANQADTLIDRLAEKKIWISTLWDQPKKPIPGLNLDLIRSLLVFPLTWTTTVEDVEQACAYTAEILKKN